MIIDRIEEQIEEFKRNFSHLKDRRIVIYGIGRSTKNILLKLSEFKIVGLLDGEKGNVGRKIYGIKVIEFEVAEQLADCIIINTSELYWNIIYQRIKNCKIPIFFKNGELASKYYKAFSIKSILEICDSSEEKKIVDIIKGHLYYKENEEMVFSSWVDWGYSVWGPVIWSYLWWLYEKSLKMGCKQLLFLARDGFILIDAYKKFVELIGAKDALKPTYVITSRRLAYAAGIRDKKSFDEYLSYFFHGKFEDYMSVRFDMVLPESDFNKEKIIDLPKDINILRKYIEPYKKDLVCEIDKERKEYKKYLQMLNIDDYFGIVDTGYTGKIADCLSELIGKKIIAAYYFYGNKSLDNDYGQYIETCFQKDSDMEAKHCHIYNYIFVIETILTAPVGTAIKIINNEFIYENKKEDFCINREIYIGIEKFLEDAIREIKLGNNYKRVVLFVDNLFNYMMTHTRLNEELQKKLHWDDSWSGCTI